MDYTGRWKLTEKEREANDAVITQLLAKVELKPGALFMRGFNEGTTKICEMFQKQELYKSESEEIQLRLSVDKKKELLDKVGASGRERDIERFPTKPISTTVLRKLANWFPYCLRPEEIVI